MAGPIEALTQTIGDELTELAGTNETRCVAAAKAAYVLVDGTGLAALDRGARRTAARQMNLGRPLIPLTAIAPGDVFCVLTDLDLPTTAPDIVSRQFPALETAFYSAPIAAISGDLVRAAFDPTVQIGLTLTEDLPHIGSASVSWLIYRPADTVLHVESTYLFHTPTESDPGYFYLGGVLHQFTAKSLTQLTDIAHATVLGEFVPGISEDVDVQTSIVDMSRNYSALDTLRRRMSLDFAIRSDLSDIGKNFGVPRPVGLTDTRYRQLIALCAYAPRTTYVLFCRVLDALLGAGTYALLESFEQDSQGRCRFGGTLFLQYLNATAAQSRSVTILEPKRLGRRVDTSRSYTFGLGALDSWTHPHEQSFIAEVTPAALPLGDESHLAAHATIRRQTGTTLTFAPGLLGICGVPAHEVLLLTDTAPQATTARQDMPHGQRRLHEAEAGDLVYAYFSSLAAVFVVLAPGAANSAYARRVDAALYTAPLGDAAQLATRQTTHFEVFSVEGQRLCPTVPHMQLAATHSPATTAADYPASTARAAVRDAITNGTYTHSGLLRSGHIAYATRQNIGIDGRGSLTAVFTITLPQADPAADSPPCAGLVYAPQRPAANMWPEICRVAYSLRTFRGQPTLFVHYVGTNNQDLRQPRYITALPTQRAVTITATLVRDEYGFQFYHDGRCVFADLPARSQTFAYSSTTPRPALFGFAFFTPQDQIADAPHVTLQQQFQSLRPAPSFRNEEFSNYAAAEQAASVRDSLASFVGHWPGATLRFNRSIYGSGLRMYDTLYSGQYLYVSGRYDQYARPSATRDTDTPAYTNTSGGFGQGSWLVARRTELTLANAGIYVSLRSETFFAKVSAAAPSQVVLPPGRFFYPALYGGQLVVTSGQNQGIYPIEPQVDTAVAGYFPAYVIDLSPIKLTPDGQMSCHILPNFVNAATAAAGQAPQHYLRVYPPQARNQARAEDLFNLQYTADAAQPQLGQLTIPDTAQLDATLPEFVSVRMSSRLGNQIGSRDAIAALDADNRPRHSFYLSGGQSRFAPLFNNLLAGGVTLDTNTLTMSAAGPLITKEPTS